MDERSLQNLADQFLTRKCRLVRESPRESFAAFVWLGIRCCVRYNAAAEVKRCIRHEVLLV